MLIPEVAVRRRSHGYFWVISLRDKENEYHAKRRFVEGMRCEQSRGTLTTRSIDEGYGRSDERRTRLHPQRMITSLQMVGEAIGNEVFIRLL